MDLNNQEKNIKTKMNAYQHEVDTDALWESLESFVPQKKKKRGFIFFQLAAALFFFSLIILYVSNQNISKYKSIQSNESSKLKTNQVNTIAANEIDQEQKNKAVSNSTLIDQPESEANRTSNNKTSIIKPSKVKIVSKLDNSTITPKHTNQINLNTTIASTTISPIELANKIENKNIIVRSTLLIPNMEKSTLYVQENNQSENIITIENQAIVHQEQIIIPRIVLELLPLIQENDPILSLSLLLIPNIVTRNLIKWNIGISSGFSNQQTHSASDFEVYADYVNAVTNTKPTLGLHAGISYYLNNYFYLNSGLSLSRMVNAIHPKWTKEEHFELLNAFNNLQSSVVQHDYEAIGYNFHYLVDIPINLGVQIFQSNRFSISAETGLTFNLKTKSVGNILDEELLLYKYDNNNPYNNRFAMSWQSALKIDYQLTKKVNLYIRPQFSNKTIQYKIAQNNISQSYKMYDLNVGLQYNL